MLTDSQRKTYHVIVDFIEEYGYAPKLPEIAERLGISSTGVVHRYVQALIKAKWLTKTPHSHRGIQLVPAKKGLPMLGKIAAGAPIEAISDTFSNHLNIHTLINQRDRFGIKAPDNSLQKEGILKGDILIIEPHIYSSSLSAAKQKKLADLWLTLLDKKVFVIKRWATRTQNRITVWPAASPSKSITYAANRIQIQGRVVGLIRLSR